VISVDKLSHLFQL